MKKEKLPREYTAGGKLKKDKWRILDNDEDQIYLDETEFTYWDVDEKIVKQIIKKKYSTVDNLISHKIIHHKESGGIDHTETILDGFIDLQKCLDEIDIQNYLIEKEYLEEGNTLKDIKIKQKIEIGENKCF